MNDPLNFGDLYHGADVYHRSWTLGDPGGTMAGYPLGWNDNGGYPSNDIFFSFYLPQASNTVISTDFDGATGTNFDTYLELFDASESSHRYGRR